MKRGVHGCDTNNSVGPSLKKLDFQISFLMICFIELSSNCHPMLFGRDLACRPAQFKDVKASFITNLGLIFFLKFDVLILYLQKKSFESVFINLYL